MRKFLTVMVQEYTRHVFRWRFLVSLMSLPALFIVALFVVYLVTPRPQPSRPIGIIDQSGLFAPGLLDQGAALGLKLIKYESQSNASLALSNGEIQAYCSIPADYPRSGEVLLVSENSVNPSDQASLAKLIRLRLLAGQPPQVIVRLTQGDHLILQASGGVRQSQGAWILKLFLPILAVFVFMLAIFSTSGFMMQAITVEKENRTIELLLTSTTHAKLLTGKMCGIILIGLTQLLVWLGFLFSVFISGQDSITWLRTFNISTTTILVFCLSLSLAFVMIAAMMVGVGAVVTQATEGQQITGPFSLPFILPFLFLFQILNHPDGSLALWMSFIPITSPITLITRLSVTPVPTWQIVLSLVIQAGFAVLLIWFASRAFRAGMLQYGKRLSLKEIFHFD